MTAPARDIQQTAERFILRYLYQTGEAMPSDVLQAIMANFNRPLWFVFVGDLQRRGLVERIGKGREVSALRLTKRGRKYYEGGGA